MSSRIALAASLPDRQLHIGCAGQATLGAFFGAQLGQVEPYRFEELQVWTEPAQPFLTRAVAERPRELACGVGVPLGQGRLALFRIGLGARR
jgi:hypothetical protein